MPATSPSLRSPRLTEGQWTVVDAFHRLWYEARLVGSPHWLGVPVLKTPMDLMAYQEVIVGTRPDWIIETGTAWGGSALYFATICDLIGHGQVCSVDQVLDVPALYRWAFGEDCHIPTRTRPRHARIRYLTGDVLDPRTVAQARGVVTGRCMLSVDSHHAADHVRRELELWHPLVTPGCYLVVEDTNMGGHPVQEAPWEGPYDAACAFLATQRDFAVDWSMTERFLMSYNTWMVRQGEAA